MTRLQAMKKYKLAESDVLLENGHAFIDLTKLGLTSAGKSCLDCGLMRRIDGKNALCKGPVKVGFK